MHKYGKLLCSLAEAMAVNRGHDETDSRLFYDEAERFLKLFQARTGHLPDDWIEVEDLFPDVLKGIRIV
jgi:hypothetical protein